MSGSQLISTLTDVCSIDSHSAYRRSRSQLKIRRIDVYENPNLMDYIRLVPLKLEIYRRLYGTEIGYLGSRLKFVDMTYALLTDYILL